MNGHPAAASTDLDVLYVGGVGRSGSTLLERLLGQLGGTVSVGELTHIWERGLVNNERCGCGEPFRSCPFWKEVGDVAFSGWDTLDAEAALALQRSVDRNRLIPLMLAPMLWPAYGRRLRAYGDRLLKVLTAVREVSGAALIVDSSKHASTAFVLRSMRGVDLRVIHLVRDSRGVAHSWRKKVAKPEVADAEAWMARVPPSRIALRWVGYNLAFHLLARTGVPTLFMRYEDLVRTARTQMGRVLVFVGRDADTPLPYVGAGSVEVVVEHSVAGNPMRFRTGTLPLRLDEQWRTDLPARHRRLVAILTSPLLRAYGYASGSAAGSRPASFRQAVDGGAGPAPSVSVIVATRDRPRLLRIALDSIRAQDYDGDIEALVVFDQSEPDTAITDADPHRRVRTLRNTRTPGLAGARNTGAEAATGTLLAFCDDDDEWLPEKIRLQVRALAALPGATVATGGVIVDFAGRSIARVPDPAGLTFAALLRDRATAAHPSTVVVRRDAFLDRIGPVDEEMPGSYGEDYEWLLRAARTTRIAVVDQPVARVLWGATSFFADRWATMIAAIDYLVAKHPEFGREPRGLARLYGRKAFAYAALGDRAAARTWAVRALRLSWREQRAYVALLVSTGLVRSETALTLAHRTGRGI